MIKISRRNFLVASSLSSVSLLSRSKDLKKVPLNLLQKTLLSSSHDPWIELDLENMSWNLSQVRKLARVPVMAVIKANAYGHGLIETGKHLERIGIDYLMVGKLQEALLLRKAGVSARILNFGSFGSEKEDEIIQNEISQSVFTEAVLGLSQTSLRLGKKTKIHIHVDTGMGRMGIPYHQALPFLEKVSSLKGLAIEGVSTTLTEDDEFDREQLRRFLQLCREAESKGISLGLRHAASSDGMLDLPSSRLDMVRPGIALYGYYPSEKTQQEDRLRLRPVLQLKSRVVSVKTLRPGDSLSYHRKFTAKKPEKIAIVPVGYSDGYPPNAVNKASVLISGRRFPLIAAITANHCVALLKESTPISTGDEVVLLGIQGKERIAADEIARWAEVSVYRILIGLNPLLPRVIA
jgi:alanine racemase